MSKIIAYTDGSCFGNPGPGGWAFLVIKQGQIVFKNSGLEYHTTNNRMEMTAFVECLNYLNQHHLNEPIELYSDSNLIVQTLVSGWKRKANLDLWQKIDQAKSGLNIRFNWVKAHHQDQYNNICDELAQAASEKAQKSLHKNPNLLKLSPSLSNTNKPTKSSDQSSLF